MSKIRNVLVLFVNCFSCLIKCQEVDGQVSIAQARFAVDLMGEICEQDNCVFSPYSVYNVLAMVALGAKGETLSQMLNVLQSDLSFGTQEQFHNQVGGLKEQLLQTDSQDGVDFRVADNVFIGDVPIQQSYSDQVVQIYGVQGPYVVNFFEPTQAVAVINNFVSEVTQGEITDFMSTEQVTPETLAVIVNALFFKGSWQVQFDPEKTHKGNFSFSSDVKFEVDMMQVQGSFRFSQARTLSSNLPKFDILELPYENSDFAMNILLPYRPLDEAREQIKATDLLVNFEERLSEEPRTVLVQMPKFTASVKTDIGQALINLGMSNLFDVSEADLSGMAGAPEDPIYVSNALHEAKIDVDEQGTKASAATAVGVVFESSIDTFEVKQPFMFTLVHKPTKAILLMGQVLDPRQST